MCAEVRDWIAAAHQVFKAQRVDPTEGLGPGPGLAEIVEMIPKFAPEGGEVTISIAQHADSLTVAVSDNGPGIAEEEVPRIFDRFYRARDGEEARSDSSGLGLAIVKRILDLHDAQITVASKLNVGTRFEFDLPLCQEAA